MFRGFFTATTSIIVLILWSLPFYLNVAEAKSNPGYKYLKVMKSDAPDKEDYFTTADPNIPIENLEKADALRIKSIQSIDSMLRDSKVKGPRKFELLLRLGELYAERHDVIRAKEINAFTQRYDAWVEKGQKGGAPKINHKSSQAQLANAAEAFRKLVREFPRHSRTAAALYSLAKTLSRLDSDTSILYFNMLLKNFPKSFLVPDTYLAMAEYYFDKHKIDQAITYYKKVLDFKDHKAYPYAVYKLGWAHYNATPKNQQDALAHVKKSVAAFKLVVRLADQNKISGQAGTNLKNEAIRDLVMVWAETEDIDSAWSYFKTIGEKDAFYDMLEKLGNIYTDHGERKKAITVYNRLLAESPTRIQNPDIHAKVVYLYEQEGDVKAVVKQLENMQKLYIAGSPWTIKNGQNQTAMENATKIVEFNLHRHGTLFHSRGEKIHSNELLTSAATLYALYLASFPSNKNAYEIRYYLAEIFHGLKKYEQAAEQYTIVAKQDPKNGKYLEPSALSAVVALNTLDAKTEYKKLPPAGQVTKPMEIPQIKGKLIEAIDNFVTWLPNNKKGYPMRFTVGKIYFDYGHYDKANGRFNAIIKEIPQSKQADASVRLILSYYAGKEDWSTVISSCKTFLNNKDLMTKELKTYVNGVHKSATYNAALVYEKRQEYLKAAEGFLVFQKEFPRDENADRALYNASLNFYKVSKVENALTASKLLIETYPQSELVKNSIVDIAQTHEALAQFEEAAKYYKMFAFSYPKDSRASASLYNAATLYKGLNQSKNAIEAYTVFIQRYPRNKLIGEAGFEIAELESKQGKNSKAIAAYLTYANNYYNADPDKALYAEAKAAELMLTDKHKNAGPSLSNVKGKLSAKGSSAALEARRIISAIEFQKLEQDFITFNQLKISDPERIEQQVQTKQTKLVSLAKRYERVMHIGNGEFVVAALYRLGQMHENFAEALFNAPSPKGASQVDSEKFRAEIEKVAIPLKDEAYKFYETAYKRSQEVETFTAWTKRTYNKMAELSPEKHPNVQEQVVEPTYLSHTLDLDDTVAKLGN